MSNEKKLTFQNLLEQINRHTKVIHILTTQLEKVTLDVKILKDKIDEIFPKDGVQPDNGPGNGNNDCDTESGVLASPSD